MTQALLGAGSSLPPYITLVGPGVLAAGAGGQYSSSGGRSTDAATASNYAMTGPLVPLISLIAVARASYDSFALPIVVSVLGAPKDQSRST